MAIEKIKIIKVGKKEGKKERKKEKKNQLALQGWQPKRLKQPS